MGDVLSDGCVSHTRPGSVGSAVNFSYQGAIIWLLSILVAAGFFGFGALSRVKAQIWDRECCFPSSIPERGVPCTPSHPSRVRPPVAAPVPLRVLRRLPESHIGTWRSRLER
jgi:hypothetical protein